MSVTKKPTVVVLMRFVITPKDLITAHVNQDMKETEIVAQVIFFNLVIFKLHANDSKRKHCRFYLSMTRCSLKQLFVNKRPYYRKSYRRKVHIRLGTLYFNKKTLKYFQTLLIFIRI